MSSIGQCSICTMNFSIFNMAFLRPCKHTFCYKCITNCMHMRGTNPCCPNCLIACTMADITKWQPGMDITMLFVDEPEKRPENFEPFGNQNDSVLHRVVDKWWRKSNHQPDKIKDDKVKMDMIGSYRKEKVLGKGGFGNVYLCHGRQESQLVAIKEISKARTSITKALMEAEIMKKLKRLDHFVHCHDVFEDGLAVYIVMEFFPFGTLHDFIKRDGIGLCDEEANKYLTQLIVGVKQLHALGLMHRDLKPKNILIGKRADGNQMKIADFGLSKFALSGITVCGTQGYMAPDFLMGYHDKAVDVYSLGGIYFFMTMGMDPYPSLKFDSCGYPIIPDEPDRHGHKFFMGRMMCHRKDERLSLDQIEFKNGTFYPTSRGSCAICRENLFYSMDMIGSYRKEEILGAGTSGKVYKCRYKSGQIFAVKEILKSEKSVEMGLMEAEILKKLICLDYYVHFYEVIKDRNAVYLVMEYYSDGTLHDLVKKNGNGCLPVKQAKQYLVQLIFGVKQLHDLGIMHRDLKPRSILIAQYANGTNQMKIAGFGFAKEGLVGTTICGTLPYMAPEIFEGCYDKSVDVYALGAIYYFMVFGMEPCLEFDKCGYPIFPNYPEKHGHISVSGRMMCHRKDERLSLDQFESGNDNFTMIRGSCAVCGKYLFYDKSEEEAIVEALFRN